MPATGLNYKFDLETRSKFTKVDCEIAVKVDGKELPNMGVLGEALEAATELFQQRITESYKVVPARSGTRIATPYDNKVTEPA